MKPSFDTRFSRFDFTGDTCTDSPLGVESDQRTLRMLSILRLQCRLQ